MSDAQREQIRLELTEKFWQGLEDKINQRVGEIPLMTNEQIISEAIRYSERIKDELEQLDEMIQVYDKIEHAVMGNAEIQKSNLFFGVFQSAHTESLMIRLRRIVDRDKRTGSLWYLCRFISINAAAFDRQWYMRIYACTAVKGLAPSWWHKVATNDGQHICPVKLTKKATDLHKSAEECADWISQNIAHLDRNATARMPTWGKFYSVLDEIRRLFKEVHCMLTGHDGNCHVPIGLDWEHCLMVPWMAPSRRFLAMKKLPEADGEASLAPAGG